jgi:hypothetical protein
VRYHADAEGHLRRSVRRRGPPTPRAFGRALTEDRRDALLQGGPFIVVLKLPPGLKTFQVTSTRDHKSPAKMGLFIEWSTLAPT